MSYYHLTIEERACIAQYLNNGLKIREIARLLNRSPSTISREVNRNKNHKGKYYAVGANRKYNVRKRNSRMKPLLSVKSELYELVSQGLDLYWSPEEISNCLPEGYRISTSTIYRAINKKLFPKDICKKLRRYGKKVKKSDKRGVSYDFSKVHQISERPLSVLSREEFGHWELDTLVLYCGENGYLATMVERKSRFTVVVRLPDKKAATMTDAIIAALGRLPKKAVKSLTVDRGLEFTDWERLEEAFDAKVYFCDPYSPEQKPTIENINGSLRQFYPRRNKSNFVFSPDMAASLLNCRPRKVLNWLSPACVFLLHLS